MHLSFDFKFALSSLISNEVSGFILEVLLEFEALDEAVTEASLFSGQELVGLQRQEAVLRALGHGGGGLIVVELFFQVMCNYLQVELSLHFNLFNNL